MKRTLQIVIESGVTTCATKSKNPKMCPMVRTSHYGTQWHCALFAEKPLVASDGKKPGDQMGWLMRSKECLDSEVM